MKKLLVIALVAVTFAACNSGETKTEAAPADSAVSATVDTAAAHIDTAAAHVDTAAAAAVDTTKK